MEIKGKVHCFFEQSGTFKNEFIKLGIPAFDYDIQDNFGQTDHYDDLFQAIDDAFNGKPSLFDNITKDDLIMAFFPCIYFCEKSQIAMTGYCVNYRKLSEREKAEKIIERSHNREVFYRYLTMLYAVVAERGLRMIIENPWSATGYLNNNFIIPPTIIDKNRRLRGDAFKKPTAYWFVNCKPTFGQSFTTPKEEKSISSSRGGAKAGLCSEERSMISPDYARNFICDFILGKEQEYSERSLFEE